jgi:hypothetical protein
MALVEQIGLSLANTAAVVAQLNTDLVAAGWTLHDNEDASGDCLPAAVDTTAETITIVGHAFHEGDYVQYYGPGAVIGGLTSGNPYYIKNPVGNTFQLASTQGGAALNLSSQGTGTHYFREYQRVWTSTGEAAGKPTSYLLARRAAAATGFTLYAPYSVNASTHVVLGLNTAVSGTTSESGQYYWFWGNKDGVVMVLKVGTTYTGYFWGWPAEYYTLQTTLSQAETTDTPKQIHVVSTAGFIAGKKYQIYSLADEGRDFLTVNTIDGATTMTVATLPRNYASGSLIGRVTNSFGVGTCPTNSITWAAGCPSVAAGTAAAVSIYYCTQPVVPGSVDPDQRGDQKMLIQPILVGEADGFVGWIDPAILNTIPNIAGLTAEDTLGVTEASNGTVTSLSATTLTDSAQGWTPDAYIGKCVILKAGTGAGQIRKITDNDATSITVATWTTNPAVGTTFVIVDEAYRGFPSSPMAYSVREGR